MEGFEGKASWIPRVLVVEDDPVSAAFLESLLLQEGWLVDKASDGLEGRLSAERNRPDLVLLDIQMPKENGLDVCLKLKSQTELSGIPVIFISSQDALDIKLAGFQAGAVDFITKPFSAQEVMARIRVHIRVRQALRMLFQSRLSQLKKLGEAQQAILPEPIPGSQFEAFYRPLCMAGGDFYEVLKVGDGVFDYVVADVAGHDATGSLMTSALKVLLHQARLTLSEPKESLAMINEAIRSSFPQSNYLTLIWMRLNRQSHHARILTAGHPPALWLKRAGGHAFLGEPGDVLGMFKGVDVQECACTPSKGDRLLLFTDGLVEHVDASRRMSRRQGMDFLAKEAGGLMNEPLKDMVQCLAARMLSAQKKPQDDLLLLGVEV